MKRILFSLLLCSVCFAQSNEIKAILGTQIDWSHPINHGLVLDLLMNENGGNLVNDLSVNNHALTIGGGMNWAAAKFGPGLSSDGNITNTLTSGTETWSAGTAELSWVLWAKCGSFAAVQYLVIRWGPNYYIRLDPTTGTITTAINTTNNGFNFCHEGYPGPTLNQWFQLAFTYRSGQAVLYLNGVQNGAIVTSLTGDVAGSSGTLNIFSGTVLGVTGLAGIADHALMYNRALTASEVAQLYREPFGGMEERSPFEFYLGGGAPGNPGDLGVGVFQPGFETGYGPGFQD